MSTGGGQGHH